MCISKRVLLFGNTQTLNFFNSHLFFDVGLIHCVFFRIQSILTHTHRGEKETTSTSSIHTRHGLITIHVYTLSSSSFTRVSLFISYIWKHFHSIPQELWTNMLGSQQKNYYSFTTFQIILPTVHHNLQFKEILKTHMWRGRLI